MKKFIRKITILTCIFALSSNMVFASTIGTVRKSVKLLKTEKVMIKGTPIKINTYNDNGFIVETVSVINSKKDSINNLSKVNSKKLKQEIINYLDSRQNISDIKFNIKNKTMSYPPYTNNPIEFHKANKSNSNDDVYVGSWGYFNATIIAPPFWIKQYDGACRGLYSGTGNATKIQLSEKYTYHGIAVSVAWPAGITASPSNDKVGVWSSLSYENTSIATAYRPDFARKCPVAIFSLEISSRADIYFGSTSYPAVVNAGCKIYDWV